MVLITGRSPPAPPTVSGPVQYAAHNASVPSGRRTHRRSVRSLTKERCSPTKGSSSRTTIPTASSRSICAGTDGRVVERCAGQGDIDEIGAQTGGRITEVALVNSHLNVRVSTTESLDECTANEFSGIGERADNQVRAVAVGQNPFAKRVCSLKQRERFAVQRRAARSACTPFGVRSSKVIPRSSSS